MTQTNLLLVEDEEHLAFTVAFNLRAEGYGVTEAVNLAAARAALDDAHFDLLLLDVMLPDGDGMAFCQELRARGLRTPIMMLTAKGAQQDIVSGLSMGADDYLTKPFALTELLGRVRALLRRHQWSASARKADDTFRFAGFTVHFDTCEVFKDGLRVEITDLELRLLKHFVENEARALSRHSLLEGVWGVHGETNTRTVDNFIVRLRRLFEPDPANPRHFLTVRGVGYRFVRDPRRASP